MVSRYTAIVDLDFPKYSVSSVGDERYIEVIRKSGKNQKPVEYKNKTEFWGNGKVIGGKLAEINSARLRKGQKEYQKSDFDIVEKLRQKEPLENILHSSKMMVESSIGKVAGKGGEYIAYLGKGDSFRVGISTLKQYKGNRENILKPTYLQDVEEYLVTKFNAIVVKDLEADDAVVMAAYKRPERVIVGVDKDYYGSGCLFYNCNRPDEGIIDCTGFGELYMQGDKVRGRGMLFKYLQVISEDDIDNYKANCFSEKKWAIKSAYKALVGCKCDKDAWKAMRGVFEMLYPEPKKITTWRGDEVIIDWLYVMQEMFDMAHLKRFRDDRIIVSKQLKEYGLL